MIALQGVPQNGGCNVFSGNYFDNYLNGVRTRYYIYDGQAVPTSTATYVNLPNGSICADLTTLQPNPLLQTLLMFLIVVGVITTILSAYMVVIKPFIKIKRGA